MKTFWEWLCTSVSRNESFSLITSLNLFIVESENSNDPQPDLGISTLTTQRNTGSMWYGRICNRGKEGVYLVLCLLGGQGQTKLVQIAQRLLHMLCKKGQQWTLLTIACSFGGGGVTPFEAAASFEVELAILSSCSANSSTSFSIFLSLFRTMGESSKTSSIERGINAWWCASPDILVLLLLQRTNFMEKTSLFGQAIRFVDFYRNVKNYPDFSGQF